MACILKCRRRYFVMRNVILKYWNIYFSQLSVLSLAQVKTMVISIENCLSIVWFLADNWNQKFVYLGMIYQMVCTNFSVVYQKLCWSCCFDGCNLIKRCIYKILIWILRLVKQIHNLIELQFLRNKNVH